MATTYKAPGGTIDVTAGGTIPAGEGVLQGAVFGIAQHAAVATEVLTLAIGGVWTMAKPTDEAWTQGVLLYWDDTAKEATIDDATGANKQIGAAFAAAGTSDATGQVLLDGVPR